MSAPQLTVEEVRERVDRGLPVRLSARRGDRDYDARAHALSDRVAVLLDGRELDWVSSWDVPAGEVVRAELGGRTFETLRGRVEVRWIGNAGGKTDG